MWIEPGTLKTRFRHLVVSGCSFTSNLVVPDGSDYAWPNMLAAWCGMKIHNLAVPGAGNDHISRSIMLYLEHNKLDPSETLVMAMWSGPGRIDWITDRELSQTSSWYSHEYPYDDHNELAPGGHWWHSNGTHLNQIIQQYAKYQSNASFALTSWLAMQNLSNYLQVHGYEYYYTSIVNYTDNCIKGDAVIVPFLEQLERIGLSLDLTDWLPIAAADHYGDWAQRNNQLADDGWHPGRDANMLWPQQVLIPVLQQLGVIDN